MTKIATMMNWSGGKDSALALYKVLSTNTHDLRTLVTTVNESFNRISMHGVRESLLDEQARQIGMPVTKIRLPEQASMGTYEKAMNDALMPLIEGGVTHSVFGDIFLEDLKQWREDKLEKVGLKGVFPLWKIPTKDILKEFWAAGFKTIVVCVNGAKLDKSFCGRVLDEKFVEDLPEDVDPCGENGEFHTFVFEAPYFKSPIKFTIGETVERGYKHKDSSGNDNASTFYFTDLIPEGEEA
ncbi:hypothetical protein HK102_012183 [Quaeritorhiza haematococci]|nr:hypothetical protein HK102_012183 [Quaeritorhiza haematococci]